MHAEWTKLVTVPAQLWTLAAVTGLMVGFTALIAVGQEPPDCGPSGADCTMPDTVAQALSGVYFAQIAALFLAVTMVSSEYQPRMIRVTLAAHPGRTGVLAAKAAVTVAAVCAAAAPGVLGSLLAGRAVLSAQGFGAVPGHRLASLSDGPLLRAALGTLLYLLLVALLGLGLAAALRQQAAAVGAGAALLYGPYLATLILPMSEHTMHRVEKLSPMTAGLAVQAVPSYAGTAPLAPWTGLAVLAAYAAAAVLTGWAFLRFRDS